MNANEQSFKLPTETWKSFDVVLFYKNRWIRRLTLNEDLASYDLTLLTALCEVKNDENTV